MGTNYYIQPKDKKQKELDCSEVVNDFVSKIKNKLNLEDYQVKFFKSDIESQVDLIKVEIRNETFYQIHIGKYSHGWRFALAGDNFKELDQIKLKENEVLVDEYGREFTLEEFKDKVLSSLSNPWRDDRSNEISEKDVPSNEKSPEGLRIVYGNFC